MKHFKLFFTYAASAALMFTSCSKDENVTPDSPDPAEITSLNFNVQLEDFETNRSQINKDHILGDGEVPSCNNEDTEPAYIRAVIEKPGGGFVDDGDAGNAEAVDIRIIPASSDSDSDGMDNWLTYEEPFLELPSGLYELLYFDVRNSNGDVLYLAPSNDDTYGPANFENFVDNPLPHTIDLETGTKHYDEVQVLCYDEVFADSYGYLFFDFEMLPLQYICLFGNECNDVGRHFPSNFRIKVWEYPSNDQIGDLNFDDDDALVNATNDVVREGGIVVQADALCIPLPDRPNVDEVFYAELYTIDGGGNETLIRRGDFSETEIDDLINEGDDQAVPGTQKYWHFREGPFCGEDSDPCLLSGVTEDWVQDFESGALLPGTGTDYIDVDTNNDGVYDGSDTPGLPAPFGGYLITNNPENYYSGFVGPQAGDAGDFIVFDGHPDNSEKVYFTRNTPDLCEGDNYYVRMRVKDISSPDGLNEARLKVVYRSGDPESATQAGLFTIDDLSKDSNSAWTTVGFIMTATEDGEMIIRIRDKEDAVFGNDFAMDDIIFSNDPTILNGVTHINPVN
ncbi:hypothetical protein [Christiangramia sp. OXR-203]|jgi:hypothetical protein|uniref:hypothetical protein n=1 Tax=Christiangramia sp. OXR-203 TaxID=3100176 RepID=UPI002AC9BC60|nr:hypothetical protein [Christiangramia sp. OXR-203]WPY99683.1 hypothetical protein T8I65_05600 [Christiangramia sp. OXR-203]